MEHKLFGPDALDIDAMLDRLNERDASFQEIMSRSNQVLKSAKRSMFALQRRGDREESATLLAQARDALGDLQLRFGQTVLRQTCAPWKAAVEEFLEALFFLQFMDGKPLSVDGPSLVQFALEHSAGQLEFDEEEIFGALSDLTGEIGRQMQMWIRQDKYDLALNGNDVIATIVEHLNRNTSGGNIRRKVDQANGNLSRSDGRVTDLKVRGLI